MTRCTDREEHCHNLLIENNAGHTPHQTVWGSLRLGLWGNGLDTPDIGSCMPRREKAIRNDCYLRNRRWRGCVYVLQMFFFVFCLFRSPQKYQTTVLGNGRTDFHETFTKRSVVTAGEWLRISLLAMALCSYGGCVKKAWARECI